MSITKTLLAGAAGLLLASGVAAANEPTKLTAAEMDQVTAGAFQAVAGQGPWMLLGVAAGVDSSSFATGFASLSMGTSKVVRSRTSATAAQESSGFAIGIPIVINGKVSGEVSGNFPFGFAEVGND